MKAIAIAGAAESAEIGVVATQSALSLAVDAAKRALADCGLAARDIDGLCMTSLAPYSTVHLANALGIVARWTDSTMVGGCSNLVHVRHAMAAINAGLCEVVLIAHGESGRSHVGAPAYGLGRDSMQAQFEAPFGTAGPMTLLSLGTQRFLADRGADASALANVVVTQRTWAAGNPRAFRRAPITVDEVLSAPMVAEPFTRPMCCVSTDAGGAVVVTTLERARHLRRAPVVVAGAGEAIGVAMVSQMPDLTSSGAFVRSGQLAFTQARVSPRNVDHAMLYDAMAVLPLYALEDLGFVPRRQSVAFWSDGHTALGGSLPVNTTGGGLNYTHSGMYGIYALIESIRQLRGEAAAQVPNVETSVAHAIGGMFQAAGTLVLQQDR